jgi:Flp pilus assembly protein TadG
MMRNVLRMIRFAWIRLPRLRQNESGTVMAFLVTIPVLTGAAAVGIETASIYRVKRQMQNAADAGAVSGSVDLAAGKNSATVTATAQYDAQRNGFTNGANGVTINVNVPPTSGPNIGTQGAVEVVVTQSQKFSLGAALLNWLGQSNTGFNIRARSVAGQGTAVDPAKGVCLLALHPTASNAISFTNDVEFTASSCALASNSSSVSALNVIKGKVTARTLYLVGNYSGASSVKLTEPAHVNYTSGIADPYAGRYAQPTLPASCTATNYTLSGSTSATIGPGRYCGGITQQSSGTLTLTPGTYYIDAGNFTVSNGSVACSGCGSGLGVTLVLTAPNAANIGTVQVSGANGIDLLAPGSSSGQPYPGIVIYQDPRISTSAPGSTMASGSTLVFTGVIYMPNTSLTVSTGLGGLTMASGRACSVMIARTLTFNGNNGYEFIKDCSTVGALVPAPRKLQVLE